MGDGYREGYEKGKSDAMNGKDRDLRPPLAKAVTDENYRKTFNDGYKEGYRDQKQK